MLHIHYGREDRNKESFLYDTIEGQAVVLVPDQYTVQAERDAFFYSDSRFYSAAPSLLSDCTLPSAPIETPQERLRVLILLSTRAPSLPVSTRG